MKRTNALFTTILLGLAGLTLAQDSRMSFFITSKGPGNGADLGGLEGADAHCRALAEAVGAGNRTWRAYLSATGVNARDRIGAGPWYNAEGVMVARNLEDLHGYNNLGRETSLSERGEQIDDNRHDILTGSQPDGTLFPGDATHATCSDWTSSSPNGMAAIGHHDREGGGYNGTSWVSAHGTRGCGQENLQSTGGDGLFYCFAAN